MYQLALQQVRTGNDLRLWTLVQLPDDSPDRDLTLGREEVLEAAGVRHERISNAYRNPIPASRVLASRYRRRRLGPPDVIHCHNAVSVAVAALAAPFVPRVLTLHNSKLSFPDWSLRPISRMTREVVAVAPSVAARYGPMSTRKVKVIENGVPLLAPTVHTARPSGTGRLDVIAVGNVYPQKNYQRMIAAFEIAAASLVTAGIVATLRIVGFGPDSPALERSVSRSPFRSAISILGGRDDVPALLASADVYLMSSDFEGLPIAMLEALAAGIPVVTTPFLSSLTVLTGVLAEGIAPDFTADSLAKTLVRVGTSPRLRSEMSGNARSRAEDFSIERCASKYQNVYMHALQRGSARSD